MTPAATVDLKELGRANKDEGVMELGGTSGDDGTNRESRSNRVDWTQGERGPSKRPIITDEEVKSTGAGCDWFHISVNKPALLAYRWTFQQAKAPRGA